MGGLTWEGESEILQRVGFLLKVREDCIDEYKRHHRAVWPEMLEALTRSGWRNYSLFMRPDGLLFGYTEVPESFRASLDRMADEDVNARWQDFMKPYFEAIGDARADEAMVELEEVFHLD